MTTIFKIAKECEDTINAWDRVSASPSGENRKKNKITIYQNKFVEKYLASAHPFTPIIWYGPVVFYGLYSGIMSSSGGIYSTILLYLIGLFVWTLVEYIFHRFAFHFMPSEKFSEKIFFFLLHGYHHEFPNDGTRLVAPPLTSWILASTVTSVFYLILGPTYLMQFLAGFFTAYVAYDWIHYYTHHSTPKNKIGKFLREYHFLHHFKYSDCNYGISNPFWDIVFGTYIFEKPPVQDPSAQTK